MYFFRMASALVPIQKSVFLHEGSNRSTPLEGCGRFARGDTVLALVPGKRTFDDCSGWGYWDSVRAGLKDWLVLGSWETHNRDLFNDFTRLLRVLHR